MPFRKQGAQYRKLSTGEKAPSDADTKSCEGNTQDIEEINKPRTKEDAKKTNERDVAQGEASTSTPDDYSLDRKPAEIGNEAKEKDGGARENNKKRNIQQAVNIQKRGVIDKSGTEKGRKEMSSGDSIQDETGNAAFTPKKDDKEGDQTVVIAATGEGRKGVSLQASKDEAVAFAPNRDVEQDDMETKKRTSTGLAIPELVILPQEEQLEVRDCEEDFFLDNKLHKVESRILAHGPFRTFLLTTLQWRPYTKKWQEQKRRWVPFCCAQIIILCLIALTFVFDMGWVCKVDTILSYYKKFEITMIRNVLWEARWFLGNIIGLWYFSTRHLEWFFATIKMPTLAWNKFDKRAKLFLQFLLFTCIWIPTAIHIWVIYQFSKEPPHLWMEILHLFGYGFRRYTTLPIFLALICILYLLDLFVKVSGQRVRRCLHRALCISASAEEYGTEEKESESQNERLNEQQDESQNEKQSKRQNDQQDEGQSEQQNEKKNKEQKEKQSEVQKSKQNEATKQFSICMEIIGQLKNVIFKTENGVKYFMLFHLVMLLLTTFLGLFSFMERLEFKVKSAGTTNVTSDLYPDSLSRFREASMAEERVQKAILSLAEVQRALILSPNNKALASNLSQVLNETLTIMLNKSESKEGTIRILHEIPVWQSIGVTIVEQINRTRLFIEMGLDCMETILLYGLPLFWLIKIDSSIDAIKEHLVDMQAQRLAFKFKMTKEAWDVISFMKTVRGVRVFGFQSTLFRTLILTFAGPILLSVIHYLLTYVHMPK